MTSTRVPKLIWPDFHLVSRRRLDLCLTALEKPGLKPLKCQGWRVRQNPEFNYLVFDLRPNTQKIAQEWELAFGMLGQDSDVIASTRRFDVKLYRPVCTNFDNFHIYFHCLHHRECPCCMLQSQATAK